MKAYPNHEAAFEAIDDAVETFRALQVFLRAEWAQNIYKIAQREHAKAWFPWTKEYWAKATAMTADEVIARNGTYYNCPQYYDWAQRKTLKAESLSRRYDYARNELDAAQIILEDEEITLLCDSVETAKQQMATRH